jgi:hypothetical protein
LLIAILGLNPDPSERNWGDDIIARLNPRTGDVESLEILSFLDAPPARSP